MADEVCGYCYQGNGRGGIVSADRELLVLAAKAAGYLINFDEPINDWYPHGYDEEAGDVQKWWNPLTDDGDRYRLAQKLRINIDFADGCAWHRSPLIGLIQEFWGEDCPDEAHAIVSVAAQLGKAKS